MPVKLENKSARILCIGLGGGESLAIPPSEGGIEVSFDDAEQERFDKALATPAVKAWIEAEELVVSEGADPAPATKAKQPAAPPDKAKKPFFGGGADKDKDPHP